MSFLENDINSLRAELGMLFHSYPELQDDFQMVEDALESETSFYEMMSRLVEFHLNAVSMVNAIKGREIDLKARRERYETKVDAFKAMMLKVMEAGQQPKVTLTEATISITKPRTSVEVTDVDALEQPFYTIVRQANKATIKKALEEGQAVNGATLSMGSPSISVRTK